MGKSYRPKELSRARVTGAARVGNRRKAARFTSQRSRVVVRARQRNPAEVQLPLPRQEFANRLQDEPTPFLTRDQLASRYQICVRTVDYWAEAQVIPTYRHGRFVRFNIKECDEALKQFRLRSRWESSEDSAEENKSSV